MPTNSIGEVSSFQGTIHKGLPLYKPAKVPWVTIVRVLMLTGTNFSGFSE